jgi:hypothetical protein
MVDGARVPAGRQTLTEAQAQFESQWAALPSGLKSLRGFTTYPVKPSEPLLKLTEEVNNNIV